MLSQRPEMILKIETGNVLEILKTLGNTVIYQKEFASIEILVL